MERQPNRSAAGRLREYLQFLQWFALELRPWWPQFGVSAVCFLGGALGHIAGYVVVFKYVSALQSDGELSIGAVMLGHATSPLVFSMATLLVLTVMLLAAALEFHGRALAARLSHDYRQQSERGLWVRVSAHNANPVGRSPPWSDALVLEMLREVRAGETSARLLALGLSNLLVLPVGLAVMFLIDLQLTLIVLAMALASVAAFYRISLQASQLREKERHLLQPVIEERRGLLERCAGTFTPLRADDPELARIYRTGAMGKAANVFLEQFLITQRGGLVGQIVVALATAVIFLAGGLHAVSQGHGWAQFLLYLVVLRLLGSKLAASARTLIGLNRYYAGLRRYAQQLTLMNEANAHQAPEPAHANGLTLDLADGTSAVCDAGEVIAVLGPPRLKIGLIAQLSAASPSASRQTLGGLALVKPAPRYWRAAWQQALGLPKTSWRESVAARLRASGLEDMASSLSTLPDSAGREGLRTDEHRALSLFINLWRVIDSGVRHIVLEIDDFRVWTQARRRALLTIAQASGGVVVVRITHPQHVALCFATRVLTSDGERLLPQGSAAVANRAPPAAEEDESLRLFDNVRSFDELDE